MKTVPMSHPKRDRKANVPVDRVEMYRTQGWVADEAPAKSEKDDKKSNEG